MNWQFLIAALAIAALFGAASGILGNWLERSKPAILAENAGTTRAERIITSLLLIIGLILLTLGLASALSEAAGTWVSLFLIILGAASSFTTALSLTPLHSVSWDEVGLSGPSHAYGPVLGTARTTIKWGDVERTGQTLFDLCYLEAGDGRRIHWNRRYKGYGALHDAIDRNCPAPD